MKKYLLTFAVALMAAFAFTACSSSSNDDDPTPGPTPVPTGQPFTVTALDGVSDIGFKISALRPEFFNKSDVKLVYSFDGKEWEDYELGSKIHLSSANPKVFLKAGTKANPNVQNKSFRTADPDNNYLTTNLTFESSMRVKVSGNLLSLLYGDKAQRTVQGDIPFAFVRLFNNCVKLVDASELQMPTNVSSNMFETAFQGCKALIAAPELPAKTLAKQCYYYMFFGCTALKIAPVLPATEANVEGAYAAMFNRCVKLNNVEMLATKVSIECVDDFLAEAGTSATNATLYVAKGMKSNPIIAAMENSTWTVKEK